jgi:hypothetical protein
MTDPLTHMRDPLTHMRDPLSHMRDPLSHMPTLCAHAKWRRGWSIFDHSRTGRFTLS